MRLRPLALTVRPLKPADWYLPADNFPSTPQRVRFPRASKSRPANVSPMRRNVVKTTVLLADIADFAAMNEVYAEFFEEPFPARSAFAVKAVPKDALVEIECIAEKK